MARRRVRVLGQIAFAVLLGALACTESEPASLDSRDPLARGGQSSMGGKAANGGVVAALGGASAAGGSAGVGQGGRVAAGGAVSVGSGGVTPNGGTTASGGRASGGATSTSGGSAGGPTGGPSCGFIGGGGAGAGGMSGSGSDAGGVAGASDGAGGTLGAAGASGSSAGGAPMSAAEQAAFCDDFEDGDAGGWQPISCSWSVTRTTSFVYQSSGGTCQSLAETGALADQVIEARVNVTRFGGTSNSYRAGLLARFTEGSSNYFVFGLAGNGTLRLMRGSSNLSGSGSCGDVPFTSVGGWHTLRLEVVGAQLRTFIDQQPVHDCNAGSSNVVSGSAGVFTYGSNTAATFDDVRVWTP